MPGRNPKTRAQLQALAQQRITDPQNQQNTAKTVRDVLEEERFSAFNRAEDKLTAAEIVGLDALLQNNLLINRIRGGDKIVQTLLQRNALVQRGVLTLGTAVYVDNPATPAELAAGVKAPAKVYVVARNDAPANFAASFVVFVDGGETTTTARAEWVDQGSTAAAYAVLPYFNPAGLPPNNSYPEGFAVKYELNGSLQGFITKQALVASTFQGGQIPAPTGDDAYYRFFSPPNAAYQATQEVTVGFARYLTQEPGLDELTKDMVVPARQYRFLRYDAPAPGDLVGPRAAYDVLVWGATPNSYTLQGAYRIDNATNEATAFGTYNLDTDEFTPGGGGAGLTPAQLLRLPAATPDSTTIWVEPGGQTEAGVIGNKSRPFPTLSAAHEAASNGARIVLLPGIYAETEVILRKNVRVDCEPGVVFTGSVLFGAFGTAQPFTSSLSGGEFTATGRLVIIRQNTGASTFSWQDGRLSGSAYVWAWSGNSTGTHTDEIRLSGLRGRTTVSTVGGSQASSGVGHRGLTVGARTDGTQRQRVIVDDSVLEVTNGEPILFQAHPDTRVVLRGATRMDRPTGTAQSRTLPLIPSNQQLVETDWLVDERIKQTASAVPFKFTATGAEGETFGPLPAGTLSVRGVFVTDAVKEAVPPPRPEWPTYPFPESLLTLDTSNPANIRLVVAASNKLQINDRIEGIALNTAATVQPGDGTGPQPGALIEYVPAETDWWAQGLTIDHGNDGIIRGYGSYQEFVFNRPTVAGDQIDTYVISQFKNLPEFTVSVYADGVWIAAITPGPALDRGWISCALPVGTTRVRIVNGQVAKPFDNIAAAGVHAQKIRSTCPGSFLPYAAPQRVILFYTDSIGVGGNSVPPERDGFTMKTRDALKTTHLIKVKGWGFRAVQDDYSDPANRDAFDADTDARMDGTVENIFISEPGRNDYGLRGNNATDYGNWNAAHFDRMHAAHPTRRKIAFVPFVNADGANGEAHRNAIRALSTGRPWLEIFDGLATLADLDGDGVHFSAAGHAAVAGRLLTALGAAPVTELPAQAPAFAPLTNMSYTGGVLTKTGGGNAFNAGATATNGIANNAADFLGGVRWRADATGEDRIIGLRSGPNAGDSFEEIDFGIYLGGSNDVSYYEDGASLGATGVFFANNTLFEVRVYREAGVLRASYWVNGVKQYTSLKPVTLPLYFDCSFFNQGTSIRTIEIFAATFA